MKGSESYGGHSSSDEVDEGRLAQVALVLGEHLSVLEHREDGETLEAVVGDGVLVLLGVDLDEPQPRALHLLSHLLERFRRELARPAPRGVEVDHHIGVIGVDGLLRRMSRPRREEDSL